MAAGHAAYTLGMSGTSQAAVHHAQLPSSPRPTAAAHHAGLQRSLQRGRLIDGAIQDVVEGEGGDGGAALRSQVQRRAGYGGLRAGM